MSITLNLRDEAGTTQVARRLGAFLRPGDVILLQGPIGAGKTHFARGLILSLLAVPEDIPSPTFTLVQIYETPRFDLWHCDLYRLSSPDEALELGLADAMETGVCLIEWPDRLAGRVPDSALTLTLEPMADATRRTARFTAAHSRWAPVLEALND